MSACYVIYDSLIKSVKTAVAYLSVSVRIIGNKCLLHLEHCALS